MLRQRTGWFQVKTLNTYYMLAYLITIKFFHEQGKEIYYQLSRQPTIFRFTVRWADLVGVGPWSLQSIKKIVEKTVATLAFGTATLRLTVY